MTTKVLSTYLALLVAVAAGFATARSAASDGDNKASLAAAPQAVQRAFLQRYPKAEVKDVEREVDDGVTIFEIEFMLNGAESEVEFREDGLQLGAQEVPFASLPDAVRASVKRLAGSMTIDMSEREVLKRSVRYECEWKKDTHEYSAKLSAAGQLMELEHTVGADALPAGVLAAFKKQFPGAKMAKAELVERTFYEVSAMVNGKKREISVYSDGASIDEEGDDEQDHDDGDDDGDDGDDDHDDRDDDHDDDK